MLCRGAVDTDDQLWSSRIGTLCLQLTVGTNHFGPFFLTHALMDKLKDSRQSRVVWTTSSAEVMNDIDFDDLE